MPEVKPRATFSSKTDVCAHLDLFYLKYVQHPSMESCSTQHSISYCVKHMAYQYI